MTIRRRDVQEILARHREELARLDVRALYLFGSVARNEAGEASDVDFEVEFASPPDFDRYAELKLFLEDVLHAPVDLLTRASIRPEIRRRIEREAVRVA